ncbi:MAG: CDP-alcohol phosphatidyltransferase family protein [Schleiferiaceae bacterium]|nr:CDP-alcohol phosphatidyltransferase family protein [Schleiferiaceae bacterium]
MRWIPNAFTLGNALMGCLALIFLSPVDLEPMTYCIGLALLFDLLDGWAARKLGVDGPMGVQLDSLADAITFGLVPGILWFEAGRSFLPWWFALVGLAPTLASIYRLARFNLGMAGSKGFIGMPTPANALFLFGVVWGMFLDVWPKPEGTVGFVFFGLITLWSTFTLNCSWPVMSFKDMPKGGPALVSRIIMAALSVSLLIIFKMAAFAFIIPLLFVFSALEERLFNPTAS